MKKPLFFEDGGPSVSVSYIPEPLLVFGNGGQHVDPKTGLTLFGPHSIDSGKSPSPQTINVAIIGDSQTISLAKGWIDQCSHFVPGGSERPFWISPFPGIKKAFGFEVVTNEMWESVITSQEKETVLSKKYFNQRLESSIKLFVDAFRRFKEQRPSPDVVICAIPEEFIKPLGIGVAAAGKDNVRLSSAEKSLKKDIQTNKKIGQQTLIPLDPELLELLDAAESGGSFWRRLKSEAMKIGIPTQIAKPDTLSGKGNTQDDATRAWNFFLAIYHKADGYPWRLERLDSDTCYVGISFYKDSDGTTRTSMAQVFSPLGKGLVTRGSKAVSEKEKWVAPHLDYEGSKRLIQDSLELYQSHHKVLPRRLVIHKTSKFWPDELKGFREASAHIHTKDFVAIEKGDYAFFRLGVKPPLRGTLIKIGNTKYLLYAKGYVPYLQLYPGPRVPRPLELIEHIGDSTPEKIAGEILSLTKLNWNTADFSTGVPITLAFSSRVGQILSDLGDNPLPSNDYRFYM